MKQIFALIIFLAAVLVTAWILKCEYIGGCSRIVEYRTPKEEQLLSVSDTFPFFVPSELLQRKYDFFVTDTLFPQDTTDRPFGYDTQYDQRASYTIIDKSSDRAMSMTINRNVEPAMDELCRETSTFNKPRVCKYVLISNSGRRKRTTTPKGNAVYGYTRDLCVQDSSCSGEVVVVVDSAFVIFEASSDIRAYDKPIFSEEELYDIVDGLVSASPEEFLIFWEETRG